VEDILDEPDETMGVVISNPINADLGDSNATGTIIDDDDMPQVSVDSPAAVIEGNNITFTVSLNTPSGLDVTVNYATS